MSDVPVYFRLFIDDYERDTRDLSLTEHGVYLQLMLWYYGCGGPIPYELPRILRRLGARGSEEETDAIDAVLTRFFTHDRKVGVWRHKRIDAELEEWRSKIGQSRIAAEKRWKINGHDHADALPTHSGRNANQNQNQKEREELRSRASPDVARQILNFLNEKTGRAYKPVEANLRLIRARLVEATPDDLRSVVAKKAREWKGTDMEPYLRPATLFNATKFAQYHGELVQEPK